MNPAPGNPAVSPRAPESARVDPYSAMELPGSHLYAHPRVAPLIGQSASALLPILGAIESALREHQADIPGSIQAEWSVCLLGSVAMSRLAPFPADVDGAVHLALRSSAPVPDQAAAKSILAKASAACLVALVDAVADRAASILEFVNVETSIPVRVPEMPGRMGAYTAQWSREDLVIGTTLASLGSVPLIEVFEKGGNAVVSFAADLDGLRTVVDLRFEPVILCDETCGKRLASPGVCHWLGRLWASEESARRAAGLEREIAGSVRGYEPATVSIKIIDRSAADSLAEGRRAAKALKHAVLALGLVGEAAAAEALSAPLRSWIGQAATIATRLALLVQQARGHWAAPDVLAHQATLLRARLSAVPVAEAHADDLQRLRIATDLWDSGSGMEPDDPSRWASLHRAAQGLADCSNAAALAWLRQHADAFRLLPMLSAAVRAAASGSAT